MKTVLNIGASNKMALSTVETAIIFGMVSLVCAIVMLICLLWYQKYKEKRRTEKCVTGAGFNQGSNHGTNSSYN